MVARNMTFNTGLALGNYAEEDDGLQFPSQRRPPQQPSVTQVGPSPEEYNAGLSGGNTRERLVNQRIGRARANMGLPEVPQSTTGVQDAPRVFTGQANIEPAAAPRVTPPLAKGGMSTEESPRIEITPVPDEAGSPRRGQSVPRGPSVRPETADIPKPPPPPKKSSNMSADEKGVYLKEMLKDNRFVAAMNRVPADKREVWLNKSIDNFIAYKAKDNTLKGATLDQLTQMWESGRGLDAKRLTTPQMAMVMDAIDQYYGEDYRDRGLTGDTLRYRDQQRIAPLDQGGSIVSGRSLEDYQKAKSANVGLEPIIPGARAAAYSPEIAGLPGAGVTNQALVGGRANTIGALGNRPQYQSRFDTMQARSREAAAAERWGADADVGTFKGDASTTSGFNRTVEIIKSLPKSQLGQKEQQVRTAVKQSVNGYEGTDVGNRIMDDAMKAADERMMAQPTDLAGALTTLRSTNQQGYVDALRELIDYSKGSPKADQFAELLALEQYLYPQFRPNPKQ